MGALFDIVKQIFTEKQKSKEEKDYFNSLKIGLQKSIKDINDTIKDIKNYDELINLNSEGIDLEELKEPEKEKRKNKLIQKQKKPYERPQYKDFYTFWSETCNEFSNSKCCLRFSFICGFIFCIIQLIGVQEGIIILNALFNEIVDEINLYRNIPKEYNFYQKIEIASYKSIPDIDVGMFWSFVGIIVLKKYGFIWSTIFQLLSLIGFILLFLLFDFHKNNKLSLEYTNIEITVLIISYFLLCISVGASSTIAIKQFYNLYTICYKKHFSLFKYINIFYWFYCCCKRKKKENEENEISHESNSKVMISNLEDSNKENFKDLKKEEDTFDKKMKEIDENDIDKNIQMFLFYNFSVISLFAVILLNRLIFSSFDNISSKGVLNIILIVYASCFALNLLFYLFYSIPLINYNITKIMNKQKIAKNGKQLNQTVNQNNDENTQMYLITKIKQKEAEIERLKKKLTLNETIESNSIISNVSELDEVNNNVPQKVCTCIGYVYFQKKIGDKNACVFYDYDSCCSWFCFKFKKPQIYGPLVVEFLIQLTVVGFNSKLSDNLLKVYSFSKNLKFFFSLLFSILYINIYLLYNNQMSLIFKSDSKIIKNCTSATFTIYLFIFFSLFSFIVSIIYIAKGYPTGKNWENNIMSEIIIFKMLDFNMISHYDFFDDDDCLNTSVIITFERFVWTIFEVLIDIFEVKLAVLISFQIAVSFIINILSLVIWYKFIETFRKNV